MKFDLHCHTKEGSFDSSISILDYAKELKSKHFDGMLVTDHDTYKGFSKWEESKGLENFIVLKGVEYDTADAGHFLVIMPDNIHLKILQIRGMTVKLLIKVVHHYGGILGPAHPFGVKSSSLMFFKKIKSHPELLSDFDFIEGFNTCEHAKSNDLAQALGEQCAIPMIGGSDAHHLKYVGMAYTIFENNVECNDDLIQAIQDHAIEDFGGIERDLCLKGNLKKSLPLIWAFKAYNKGLGYLFSPYRKFVCRELTC